MRNRMALCWHRTRQERPLNRSIARILTRNADNMHVGLYDRLPSTAPTRTASPCLQIRHQVIWRYLPTAHAICEHGAQCMRNRFLKIFISSPRRSESPRQPFKTLAQPLSSTYRPRTLIATRKDTHRYRFGNGVAQDGTLLGGLSPNEKRSGRTL